MDRLLGFGVKPFDLCPNCAHPVGSHPEADSSKRKIQNEEKTPQKSTAASAAHVFFEVFNTAAHGFKIMMGDVERNPSEQSVSSNAKFLNDIALCTVQKACEVSQITEMGPPTDVVTELAEIFAFCSRTTTEGAVQKRLRAWSTKHKVALDTSKTGHAPWFLPKENLQVVESWSNDGDGKARYSDRDYPVYKANATADLIHANVPVALEVKKNPGSGEDTTDADLKLVTQMVTRVCLQIRLLGYLSRSLCIGSTGRNSWLAAAVYDCHQNKHQVTILRLASTTDAARLFLALGGQSLVNYLTDDGPILIKALQFAQVDPAVCRVRRFPAQGAHVYSVTPGVEVLRGAKDVSGTCLGVPRAPKFETLALKVLPEEEEYKREVRALSVLVPAYHKKKLFHYGLAHVSSKDHGKFVEKMLSVEPPQLIPFSNRKEAVWWNFASCPTPKSGCILMQCGTRTLEYPFTDALWAEALPGAATNLHIAHSLGICHSDIRCSNIVEFGPRNWLLIDWGLSCGVEEETIVEKRGDRGERVGVRVKEILAGTDRDTIEIKWCPEDDWDMLAHMPLKEWKSVRF